MPHEPKLFTFYDTSCFNKMPYDELKETINESENILISPVIKELEEGFNEAPNNEAFKLVFKRNGLLRKGFQEVSLDRTEKSYSSMHRNEQTIQLKQHPCICSSYYTWLPGTINPALVTNHYRHLFNNYLWLLKKGEPIPPELSKIMGNIKAKEAEQIDHARRLAGRSRFIESNWVLKARNKQVSEVRKNKFKLVDYQIILSALLYACIMGVPVNIITYDRDLLDIQENLIESIIESYVLYNLLMLRLKYYLSQEDKDRFYTEGLQINITREEIYEELKSVTNQITESQDNVFAGVYLKLPDGNMHIQVDQIPLWLRDFILQYKSNLDCYSLDPKTEFKYPIIFYKDPTKKDRYIRFYIWPRKSVFYTGMHSDCERICRYAKEERLNPQKITCFMDPKEIPSE
ncbi:MAG: hypothetical protein FH758_13675 [Firmicutes bacterium]|nr:hypothetical protein [Bacillota bacterium]